MSVTLKDIAARVGKSVPTVSRALAGYKDISPRTREEVQRVADELGYEPNVTARNLQKKRTGTIALLLPAVNQLRFSDPFFSELLSGILKASADYGFSLHISANYDNDEAEVYHKHIRSRRADGYVVVRTRRYDERINILREYDVPFVAFGRVEANNDFHLVDEDGYRGIRQVVDHLVALGHERLACIAEPTDLTKSYHRVQGFRDGLRAHQLPFDPHLLIETHFRQRSGFKSARKLLQLPQPPTAIVAGNDLLALGAMGAAQEQGLVIGQDISITGFDDILLAEYAHPPLTTVHQPAQEIGRLVAKILLQVIHKEPVLEKQVILQPALVVRQSTGRVSDNAQ